MSKKADNPVSVFGSNLSNILKFLEMTQVELALQSGLTQAAISQIISGEREPSLGSIIKILRVIPVKFERLMMSGNMAKEEEKRMT